MHNIKNMFWDLQLQVFLLVGDDPYLIGIDNVRAPINKYMFPVDGSLIEGVLG